MVCTTCQLACFAISVANKCVFEVGVLCRLTMNFIEGLELARACGLCGFMSRWCCSHCWQRWCGGKPCMTIHIRLIGAALGVGIPRAAQFLDRSAAHYFGTKPALRTVSLATPLCATRACRHVVCRYRLQAACQRLISGSPTNSSHARPCGLPVRGWVVCIHVFLCLLPR